MQGTELVRPEAKQCRAVFRLYCLLSGESVTDLPVVKTRARARDNTRNFMVLFNLDLKDKQQSVRFLCALFRSYGLYSSLSLLLLNFS